MGPGPGLILQQWILLEIEGEGAEKNIIINKL